MCPILLRLRLQLVDYYKGYPESTIEEHVTNDMEVTPLVETDVTFSASTESFIHINGGFPGLPNDYVALSGYANDVAFIQWHG